MRNFIILAGLLAMPLTAHADPRVNQRIEVSFSGLELAKPADAAAMVSRIEAAVRPICIAPGFANGRTTAGCVRDLTRDAVKNLRIPQLTLAFENRAMPASRAANG